MTTANTKEKLPEPFQPEAMMYPGWWAGVAVGSFFFLFGAFLPQRG